MKDIYVKESQATLCSQERRRELETVLNLTASKPDSQQTWQPTNLTANKPGSQQTWQPTNLTASKPDSQQTWQPANLTASKHDSQQTWKLTAPDRYIPTQTSALAASVSALTTFSAVCQLLCQCYSCCCRCALVSAAVAVSAATAGDGFVILKPEESPCLWFFIVF
jgi:hypothetical protein